MLEFGAPPEHFGQDTFAEAGVILQLGVAPRRIDIITSIDNVNFEDAWNNKIMVEVDGLSIPVLGFDDLIQNKKATGREKDALDVNTLIKQRLK